MSTYFRVRPGPLTLLLHSFNGRSRRLLALCASALLLPAAGLLSGCAINVANSLGNQPAAAVVLSGGVHGGQAAIADANVFLYAARTGAYGSLARPMLTQPVTTDSSGKFSITEDYTCQPGDQVYLLASGGKSGTSTTNNNSIALAAALGSCSALTPSTSININEVTTVAAAYALSGFMTGPASLSSSGTPLALTGVANAFLNAANLASVGSGTANANTAAGNGTVPAAEINSLANVLSACVSSAGSGTPCAALFAAATPSGGTAPADTLTAALNIAHNPGQNVGTLFALSAASGPFQPSLSAAPHDWSVAVTYTGGGIGNPPTDQNGVPIACCPPPSNHQVAIDGLGDVWVLNLTGVSVLDPAGNPLSPTTGFTAGLSPFGDYEYTLAIDPANNAWVSAEQSYTFGEGPRLLKLNSAGTLLSPPAGYTGGGLYSPYNMTFDSAGNAWVSSDDPGQALAEFSSSGVPLSPPNGYAVASGTNYILFYPTLMADAFGHVFWDGWEFGQGGAVAGVRGCGGNARFVNTAADANGNVWLPYPYQPVVLLECSSTGAELSPVSGYPIDSAASRPVGVAADGTNRIWFVDSDFSGHVGDVDSAGNLLAPPGGYQMEQDTGNTAEFMALDPSGNIWLSSGGPTLVEFVGLAAPVVTPLATALATNSLGKRP